MNTSLALQRVEPLPSDPDTDTPTSERALATTHEGPARRGVPPAPIHVRKLTETDCRERLDELAGLLGLRDLEALNDVGDFLLRLHHARGLRTWG
jgi:hypothetical protein